MAPADVTQHPTKRFNIGDKVTPKKDYPNGPVFKGDVLTISAPWLDYGWRFEGKSYFLYDDELDPANDIQDAVPGTSAFSEQIGGSHYKDMPIQPLEYIMANGIPFAEGNVIKYVSRWRKKNGLQDLEKSLDMLKKIIEQVKAGTYK